MPVAVVKLGSSIVAEDTGALRLSVVGRICEEVAALHASGVDVVVVTAARSRAASTCSAWARARGRSRSSRRRPRSARAGCTAPTTSTCASAA